MKILKYEKKGNSQYKIYLEDGNKIDLYEDVIIKNNLLYKKEIDSKLLDKLDIDNKKEDVYNRCVKYISVRIRSIYEIEEYLRKKEIDLEQSNKIINKLVENNLLNDDVFTKAFINDKLNFTTMGPYRIEQELKKHRIDSVIINRYLYDIDDSIIDNKINKQIAKLMKSSKKKVNLRNKIYMNLLNLGYSNEMILRNINNFDFN
jgi:regulatory protein